MNYSEEAEKIREHFDADAPEPDAWPHTNEKGKPIKHWENTRWFCDERGIAFKYNELTKKTETDYPSYKNLSADSVITDMRGLCALQGYTLSKADMADHIALIAERNSYNPVRNYLWNCLNVWDGKNRIRDLFNMFILNEDADQDPDFAYTLFEKWLITAAKMPFNEGDTSAQGVLVLVGPQGIGKTRWMLRLLPSPEWGKSGVMLDLRNKDTIMQALSFWIVELGEYGRTLTAEKSDHYKAFVTDSSDIFRIPYARTSEKHPRTTVFYATTDADSFLHDDAGERRNWTISISGIQNIEIEKRQLWGEVAYMALVENRPHWLTKEEISRLNLQNEAYKARSPEYLMLYDALDWDAPWHEWLWLTATEICRAMSVDKWRSVHIGRALGQLINKGVRRDQDTSRKKYIIPPFRQKYQMDYIKEHIQEHEPPAASL